MPAREQALWRAGRWRPGTVLWSRCKPELAELFAELDSADRAAGLPAGEQSPRDVPELRQTSLRRHGPLVVIPSGILHDYRQAP
jgi:hypothetical protein